MNALVMKEPGCFNQGHIRGEFLGRYLPGKDVLAGVWVGHGPKLRHHNPVGLHVPFIGLALQELAPVGHPA